MDSPPASPLSTILENITLSRTPLKAFSTNVPHVGQSTSKSPYSHLSFLDKGSNQTSNQSYRASAYIPSTGSIELLQARIEHLERERVDLSLRIHQKDEKDRTFRLKIENLELQLKNSEESRFDLQGVLESHQKELSSVQMQKRDLEQEVKRLQKANQLAVESEGLWTKLTASARELTRLEEETKGLRDENNHLRDQRDEQEKRIQFLEEKLSSNDETIKSLSETVRNLHVIRKQFADATLGKNEAETVATTLRNQNQELEQQHEAMKHAFEKEKLIMLAEIESLQSAVVEAKNAARFDDKMDLEDDSSANELQQAVISLKEKLVDSENKRRKLHNMLQDLRGNIRVFVRCRPFLPSDREESNQEGMDDDATGCLKCNIGGNSVTLTGPGRGSGQTFCFDNVFSTSSTQQDVYREVADLVQSAMDGYRVCIFSYGQTGSGKTHTMSGDKFGSSRGIIPRSVEQILTEAQKLKGDGWEIVVTTSILEIYNEEIRDLLLDHNDAVTGLESSAGNRKRSTPQISNSNSSQIKVSNIHGKVFITGLTSVELNTKDTAKGQAQVASLLDHAAKLRSTASTSMNEYSSRSHLLFMVDIQAQHEKDPSLVMKGGLRLCDLAGSERLDRTGTLNDATRLKETVNINKSLSSLADVFIALGNKASHVPYRNSKLTMLLQDCLSGDGKALMFVNVSPTMASSQETLCSLRFATQVSQVELGKATKQIFSLPPQVLAQSQPQTSQPAPCQPSPAQLSRRPSQSFDRNSSTMGSINRSVQIGALADHYPSNDASTDSSVMLDMSSFTDKTSSKSLAFETADRQDFDPPQSYGKAGMAVMTMAGARRGLGDLSSKRSSILGTRTMSISSTANSNILSCAPAASTSLMISNASHGIINAGTLSRGSSSVLSLSQSDGNGNNGSSFAMPTRRPRHYNSFSSLNNSGSGFSSGPSTPRESIGGSKVGWR